MPSKLSVGRDEMSSRKDAIGLSGALQKAERSLVLVTHTHNPTGSVKGAVQDYFFFLHDVFVTPLQSCILDSIRKLMFG